MLPHGFQQRLSRYLPHLFTMAAFLLCGIASVGALVSLFEGALHEGLLLGGIALFAAWMATAIQQFQSRLAAIDEVVRQGQQRVDDSMNTVEEIRRAARRLADPPDPNSREDRDRTLH